MGGGGGGGSTSSSSGFTSALNSSGTIQTLKANSLSSPLYAFASSSSTTNTASSPTSFSTVGQRRAPSYVTVIGFKRGPGPTAEAIQADLRQSFDRAPTLTNGRGIQVVVNGSTVVLQGTVPTIRERRVAEVLARMAPGVVNVRNELQVPPEGVGEE
jgi:hypothetical protein